jgi:hypothetical protein
MTTDNRADVLALAEELLALHQDATRPFGNPGKLDEFKRKCFTAVPILARALSRPVPEGWDKNRWSYTTLFNAIAAAVTHEHNAIGISVCKFEEAMIAAAPAEREDR